MIRRHSITNGEQACMKVVPTTRAVCTNRAPSGMRKVSLAGEEEEEVVVVVVVVVGDMMDTRK
jgi:hypothetical protein